MGSREWYGVQVWKILFRLSDGFESAMQRAYSQGNVAKIVAYWMQEIIFL